MDKDKYKKYNDWFFRNILYVNGKFMNQTHANECISKIKSLEPNWREIEKTVFNEEHSVTKGFSALLKSSLIAPNESLEVCVRLVADRFPEYRFFILSIFTLFVDFPESRNVINNIGFYDDVRY